MPIGYLKKSKKSIYLQRAIFISCHCVVVIANSALSMNGCVIKHNFLWYKHSNSMVQTLYPQRLWGNVPKTLGW